MTSWNHFGGSDFFREVMWEEMRRADERWPTEDVGLFWCERMGNIIDVARTAVVARGATPGGLTYDMTILSEDALSEVADDRKINPGKPPRISIEDVFVAKDVVAFIPRLTIELIDSSW